MDLQQKVAEEMKTAMKARDRVVLESLRAIKSAVLLAQTEKKAGTRLTGDEELKLLQKLVKQRKDSASIYREQGRADLMEPELAQAAIIERFLPEQVSEEEIEKVVQRIISESGASGMNAMGMVMGKVTQELAGRADGKTISGIVRRKLAE
jgi:uncharacterized protein YqeY